MIQQYDDWYTGHYVYYDTGRGLRLWIIVDLTLAVVWWAFWYSKERPAGPGPSSLYQM